VEEDVLQFLKSFFYSWKFGNDNFAGMKMQWASSFSQPFFCSWNSKMKIMPD
jgi:hypothetical protein